MYRAGLSAKGIAAKAERAATLDLLRLYCIARDQAAQWEKLEHEAAATRPRFLALCKRSVRYFERRKGAIQLELACRGVAIPEHLSKT